MQNCSGMKRTGSYDAAPLCARAGRAVSQRTVLMLPWLKKHPLRRLLWIGAVVILVVLTALAWLVVPENREHLREAFSGQHAQADPTPPPAPASKDNGNSEAERIARLHRLIEADENQLADAKKRLSAPDSEY